MKPKSKYVKDVGLLFNKHLQHKIFTNIIQIQGTSDISRLLTGNLNIDGI